MNIYKKYGLFLILLPIFFCLHAAVDNFGNVRFSTTVILCLILIGSIFLLFIFLNRFIKNLAATSITSFYISIWYLFFGAIHDAIKSLPFLFWLQKYSIILPILFLSTILLAIFLKKKKTTFPKLFSFLNILLTIYCAIDIFILATKTNYSKVEQEKNSISFDNSLVKKKPNVYLMMFDGYPGYESLRDSFLFKNDSLYDFLSNNNFKILPTFSNYNYTYYSIASIFNLNYIKDASISRPLKMDDFNLRAKEIKYSNLVSIFKSMNYSIRNFSLYDLKDNPGVGYSFGLNIGNFQLITDKMLHERFVRDVGWVFITVKYAIPFFKNKRNYESNKYNDKVQTTLSAFLGEKNIEPQFIYLHFLLPHWPYYYDENSILDTGISIFDESAFADKAKFLGYLKYTNNKMKSFVNQIISKDSSAIIICMSDHGFREYISENKKLVPAVFDNFCAVRFANSSSLPTDNVGSNVNIFRYLFNAQFNQNLPYLKDTSFFLEGGSKNIVK
jgi:hypothetical protein